MALIIFLAVALLALILLALIKKRMRIALIASRTGFTVYATYLWMKLVRSYSFKKIADWIIDRPDREDVKRNIIHISDFSDKYKLSSLRVQGRIGLRDDAANTAILCGVLRSLVETVYAVCVEDAKTSISITPDFSRGIFWLYLEGILIIYPGKITFMLIKLWLRRKVKNGASN